MRLALPLFEDDVSPRFCGADRILVVDIEEGRETGRHVVDPVPADFFDRLVLLRDLGVRELLCGGFNRCWLPLAESLGLRVFWGLWGPAEAVLQRRMEGLDPTARGRFGGGRRQRARRGRRP
ncbi:MAG: hypothetical protein JXB39_12150 [Deltaproteobacteria bacterium]|nr:hypothetical protein [Deltaproteobacteria bacterium]